jgi:hypothetical protein
VIKFVSDLPQVGGFLHKKVALSTIKPNLRIGRQFENLQKGHKSTDVCDIEIKHGLEAGRRSESNIYMVVHKIFQQYT